MTASFSLGLLDETSLCPDIASFLWVDFRNYFVPVINRRPVKRRFLSRAYTTMLFAGFFLVIVSLLILGSELHIALVFAVLGIAFIVPAFIRYALVRIRGSRRNRRIFYG